MRRGNSHRERERQSLQHADETWGEAPPHLGHQYVEGQYSTFPPAASTRVSAQVKWFNPEKGFGFVSLPDGTGEAFLPARVVQAAGYRSLNPGVALVARLGTGPKGPQVTEIVSVGDGKGKPELPQAPRAARLTCLGQAQRSSAGSGTEAPLPHREAVVKWFDSVKGFGFVTVDGEPKDLFVHVSVLRRAGLSALEVGQAVRVAVVDGRNGYEIGALSLP